MEQDKPQVVTQVGQIEIDCDQLEDTPPPAQNDRLGFTVVVSQLRRLFGCKKNSSPRLQHKPRVVTDFLSLGTRSILNRNPEIDDRLHIFQEGIELMSERAPSDRTAMKLRKAAVTLLYNKGGSQSAYLSAPLGHSPETLPSVSQIFERLLKGSNSPSPHPSGISSLAFAFANIISLSLSPTSPSNSRYNETLPRLDLSPLYGSNEGEEDQVRARNGRGMLSPDCFFEDRLTFLPPAVSALLIMWSRNHNHIARYLLLLNEDGRWKEPLPDDEDGDLSEELATQDNEIFRIARRINCGNFRDAVRVDFLKSLCGLSSVGSANSDMLCDALLMNNRDGIANGQGQKGNVECSLLYNWPAMASPKSVELATKDIFGELSPEMISPQDFKERLEFNRVAMHPDRRRRNYAGLKRGSDGCFNGDDLARILQDATESPATACGARTIHPCMQVMEMVIMKQAREWGVCSLNDFRRSLGLKPLTTFEEWNSDPEIVRAAAALYKDIDMLELYPGLQAEKVMPGSGFHLGYTMTFGLLVNLVTVILSDPGLTTEFTSKALTKWGSNEFAPQPDNGAFGAMFPKLLLRNLPRHYTYNNIYGLFPFTLPTTTRKDLTDAQLSHLYDMERPVIRKTMTLNTRTAIQHVLNNPTTFPTSYGRDLKFLTNGYGYFLGFDNENLHDADQMMTLSALIPDRGALSRYATYFRRTATRQIEEKSEGSSGVYTIDIIRDVINVTCIRWVCETLSGIPLKGTNNEAKLFDDFSSLYAFIFRNIEPEKGWMIRSTALDSSKKLSKQIEKQLCIASKPFVEGFTDAIKRIFDEWWTGLQVETHSAHTFLARLKRSSETTGIGFLGDLEEFEELETVRDSPVFQKLRLVANVLGLSVVASVTYAQTCAHAVDFYLDDERKSQRAEIVKLSTSNKPEDNRKIMGYIREAQRMNQPLGLFRDINETTFIPQGEDHIVVQQGDRIFADLKAAHLNPVDFKDPLLIDCTRKTPSIQGMGLHKCPGITLVDETMPEIFKAIFRLKNLRRTPGKKGRLTTFTPHANPLDSDPKRYLGGKGETTIFPGSLVLQYDKRDSDRPAKRKRWIVSDEKYSLKRRQIMDFILKACAVIFLLWRLINFSAPWWSPLLSLSPPPLSLAPPRSVIPQNIECPAPVTVFQPWEANTILPGPNDKPLPIEYILDYHLPHRISIIDIDARDMEIEVYVDGILRGLTSDFALNKSVNCGDDRRTCRNQNFSAGTVVVPSGKHTVKLAWGGKEFLPDTRDIDWGEERSRRFMWKREYCS